MNDFSPLPDYPQIWLAKEWTSDVVTFMNNSTIWDEFQPATRSMYIVIPLFYSSLLIVYFLLIRKIRRKTLYVNGVKFGTVMWIHGYRRGHIYDLACLLFNRGRHFDKISDFPRLISGDFMKDCMVIYYRPFFFHHPIDWFRLIVDECVIYTYGVQVIVPLNDASPINVYSHRVTDPLRPQIVNSDLRHSSKLKSENMDLKQLTESHVATQEQMIRNTWRMGRAEPGTALSILAKASYSIPDRTLKRFWDKLPERDQDLVKEEWKGDEKDRG